MARRRLIMYATVLLLFGPNLSCTRDAAPPGVHQVKLGGSTFGLELALDDQTRIQGLSDRAQIADVGGMLFVFPNPKLLAFVMRRCLVPIDLLILDPGGRVIAMHRMQVEPYDTPERDLRRYGCEWPAQFAIELKGGTIDRIGIQPGHTVELPLEDLKRRAR